MRNRINRIERLSLVTFALLIVPLNQVYSQTTIILNQPETGNQIHKANYKVGFQVGYHYSATATANLHGFIDESVTGDTPTGGMFTGGLGGTFDSRTINTNLAVGTIDGKQDVTASGAATYSIPIKLPLGINGKSPSLSINYNSQSDNGLLGMGWHLGGISVITRSSKNIYNDNAISPIYVDNTTVSDAFSLDGNRLIATNGIYGDDGTIYATEQETFNKVTSKGITGDGPTWFKVESKNGLTFEYGNSLDAKNFPNKNRSSIISWYLNKVTDKYSNYYIYHYRTENNEVLLDKIEYGGNQTNGIQPFNSVQFIYNIRNDSNRYDIADEVEQQNVVLSHIKIRTEGTLVRTYEFKYGYQLYTYLTEVKEYGSDNSSLNSTIFKYGDVTNSISEEPILNSFLTPTNGAYEEFWSGDYNADGKTDLLGFNYDILIANRNPKNQV